MEPDPRPIVAITMGDPAGIGPEIAVGALAREEVYQLARPFIVGDRRILADVVARGKYALDVVAVAAPSEGRFQHGTIDVIDVPVPGLEALQIGVVQAVGGEAGYAYVKKATELILDGQADTLATGPLHKESLRAAGVPHIGHTEMLAALTDSPTPLTMFEVNGLRIFFLTRHVSLRQACDLVTRPRVVATLQAAAEALQRLGVDEPSIAVAGLNPHCGENGLFGDEEVREVEPAVEEARRLGINAHGPVPADSVFHLARLGRYDAVLSLYHDQGHIAAKMVDFERTVSITNGLPFLRTSVDHGTAFDIAGKGIASCISMLEAIKVAARYAPLFRGNGVSGKR